MSTKAKGISVTQKLIQLSAKQGALFPSLVTIFLIERLVSRLVANEKLRNHLVFKGGFVGLKVYESPRYTVDLDALLVKANVDATLDMTKAAAESDLDDGVWFRFQEEVDLATQGEYGGIRQIYRAGIGEMIKNVKKAQIINFDLGIGDPVTPGPFAATTRGMISNETLSWSVYPIETIIAEKLHAVVAHADGNSRSKDIHDLALFLPKADKRILRVALEKCFSFRGTALPKSMSKLIQGFDTSALERGWASATASVPDAPKFQTAFASLVSQIEDFEQD
jgi:hypothetical protein